MRSIVLPKSLGITLVLLLALLVLPVERVVADEIAPETRSATLTELPVADESGASAPDEDRRETSDDDRHADGTFVAPSDIEEPDVDKRQLSEVIEAPLPFSGLGLVGSGDLEPEIHWRALETDGRWSDWHPAPILEVYDGPDPDDAEGQQSNLDGAWVSDAIWVGAATHLQLDIRGANLDDLEVTFIDTAGLSESLPERVLRKLRSLGTEPPPADASVSKPPIISRAEWGANESCTSGSISYANPHFTVIHHTATNNTYTEAEAAQQVRNIYHWHTACHGSGNNWYDMGYNFLIDRFGNIYEGRRGGIDKGVVGAHAAGYNSGSFGVGLMGNHNTAVPSPSSLSSLNELLRWKFHIHDIPTSASSTTTHSGQAIPRLVGHRNVRGSYTANPTSTTDCPGQHLYLLLDTIRQDLAAPITTSHTGLGHRSTTSVTVTGNGVPSDAKAVVLNVTAANPTHIGYLTVWPRGTTRPGTSTLNTQPGSVIANEIIAKIGDNGRVNVYNHNGKTDVIIDVLGYFPTTADYTPVTPARRYDTRTNGSGPIGPEASRAVMATGAGVPSDAHAVVFNVTAANATRNGYLTVWPRGTTRPGTSTLNTQPGSVIANEIIAKVGDNKRVNVYNHNGETDVIIDVLGYFPAGSSYIPATPARRFDTRASEAGPIDHRATRSVQVTGNGVPSDAKAVVLNVTAANPTHIGYLTVWPRGTTRPGTSTLNTQPGSVIANEIIAKIGDNGRVNVYNHNGKTDVIIDVLGYFPTTADYTPVTPARRYDTRTGGQK